MNATRNRAGVILAGGASARMGEDKALLTAPSGLPLVEHIRNQFATIVSTIAISAQEAKRYCPGVPHITDKRSGMGPCAGIEASLVWAREQHAKILLTWPVDVPLVPAPWMNELAQSLAGGEARSCYLRATLPDGHAEGQPLCAAWNVDTLDIIREYLDGAAHPSVYGLHDYLGSVIADADRWCPDAGERRRAMLNLNTPEDYQRMRAMWR